LSSGGSAREKPFQSRSFSSGSLVSEKNWRNVRELPDSGSRGWGKGFLPRAKGAFHHALAVKEPPFHEGFSGQPRMDFSMCPDRRAVSFHPPVHAVLQTGE